MLRQVSRVQINTQIYKYIYRGGGLVTGGHKTNIKTGPRNMNILCMYMLFVNLIISN
jgi:hypothetical protein